MIIRKIIPFASILLSCFFALNSWGQTDGINTDRPDQSEGVSTLHKHKWQLETGMNFSKETLMNESLLRYGLTQITETRLFIEAGKDNNTEGLKPISLSIKQKILSQDHVIPAISFVGYIAIGQLASKNFKSHKNNLTLILAFENELSEKLSLGYNLGMSDNFETLNTTAGLNYLLTPELSVFIEYFASFSDLEKDHNLDLGILFSINPDFQFDLACGHSLLDTEDSLFVTLGASCLF